jgi:integrase
MASLQHRRDRYYVRWRDGGRESKEHTKVFATLAEAEDFKREIESRETARRVLRDVPGIPGWGGGGGFLGMAPQPDAFVEYARRLIELDDNLRPGTKALYLRVLRLHFEGTELGASPVHAITPEVIADWWRRLPDTEAKGVRRQAHQILAKILNRAVVTGDIEVSPLTRLPEVKRPRTGRAEIEALTVRQVEALAAQAAASQWDEYASARNQLEILVMAWAGLRAGEVGALKRRDVVRDGDRCSVRVRQQVVRITGGDARLADVKTAAGRRTIFIPCSLADEIDAFLEQFGAAKDGRIFHGSKGSLRYAHLINHSVASAGKKIGLDVNAHQLRHTAASLLRRSGADIRALQRFMGHSDIRVTLGTYSHLYTDELVDLADRMEALREDDRNGEALP